MDNLLPEDNELLRREGLFLKLFDKFSVDEGSDPELGDIGAPDFTMEDNSGSGSSFSETSDIESVSEESSVIETIKQQMQPVIVDRVNAWPEKGINLQLKTVDPRMSVEEWLKANSEFTTTTKKYKKTVVNENNKTITTTTKHMKTTTKKTSFQSFIPRVLQNEEYKSDHMKAIEDKVTTRPKRKGGEKETKVKQQKKTKQPEVAANSQVPNSVHCPRSNDKQKKGIGDDAKDAPDITEPIRKHKKQSSLKDHNKQSELISEKKTSDYGRDYPVVSTHDSTKRFLRPRNKEIIVPTSKTQKKASNTTRSASEIRTEPVHRSRSPLKEKIPSQIERASRNKADIGTSNKTQKKQDNPKTMKLKPAASSSTRSASEIRTKPFDRSRSPLKEKISSQIESVSERALKDKKLKNVTVHLKKLPAKVNIRRNAQITNTVEPVSTFDDTTSELVCNYDETIGIDIVKAKKPIRYKKPPIRQIVIHAPGSDTILGTKIDDTSMLVTKRDYKKHINRKDLRNTDRSFMNNSIIPINRKIVYQRPTNIIEDNSGSEGEDVLLTSYTNTGHILQIGSSRF